MRKLWSKKVLLLTLILDGILGKKNHYPRLKIEMAY
jgi:hypothetical protein